MHQQYMEWSKGKPGKGDGEVKGGKKERNGTNTKRGRWMMEVGKKDSTNRAKEESSEGTNQGGQKDKSMQIN